MKTSIKIATIEEKQTIHDLLQPYIDELSNFPDENPEYKDEKGIYHYPYLDVYWQEDVRYPYLLFIDNKIAGFALVSLNAKHWSMAEFYVSPQFRRLGLGESCAKDIIRKHPGEWKISFNKQNLAGRSLWHKLADQLSKSSILAGELDTSHDYIRFSI